MEALFYPLKPPRPIRYSCAVCMNLYKSILERYDEKLQIVVDEHPDGEKILERFRAKDKIDKAYDLECRKALRYTNTSDYDTLVDLLLEPHAHYRMSIEEWKSELYSIPGAERILEVCFGRLRFIEKYIPKPVRLSSEFENLLQEIKDDLDG